jgi:hypothetical protein
MTSVAIAGRRCQVTKPVQSAAGRIERFAEGRIRYVTENLGRLLFVVDWERGGSTVVFPEEISLLSEVDWLLASVGWSTVPRFP